MSRYIDVSDLNIPSDENDYDELVAFADKVAEMITDAPSIDVVRCAECVYCNIQNTKYLYAICERHGIEFKPFEDDTRTHGCTWGERKESE